MTRLVLLECWFGPFPAWFDFYLKSCELNHDVNWVVFTDQAPPPRQPANVRFVALKKNALEEQASTALGVPIKLASGFKVCDLRPTFGLLFRDHVKDYDFWGYNDSDLFWGRIRTFLTPELFDRYDVLSACRTSICGQFTLFKNNDRMRRVFEYIPDYLKLLEDPAPAYADEVRLDEALLKTDLRIYRRQLQVHDVGSDEWEQKARALELKEKGHLDDWFWEGGACRWETGRLIHIASGKETMFFHFKHWKGIWKRERLVPPLGYRDNLFHGFDITEQGIHPLYKNSAAIIGPATVGISTLPYRTRTLFMKTRERAAQGLRGVKRRLF